MPLINRNNFPPGGWLYREPSLNWPNAEQQHQLAMLPFSMVVDAIQAVRMANPAAGLNPDRSACEDALDAYTCARLHDDPLHCYKPQSRMAVAMQTARKAAVPCGSCGKRR